MGGKSFRVIFGLGLLAAVAWSTPACSGSDESGGGTGGSGAKGGSSGKGATGGTTTGGSSGSGGADGAAVTTTTCSGTSCSGAAIPAIIQSFIGGQSEVPPCCPTQSQGDVCGLDVTVLNHLQDAGVDLNISPVCQAKHQVGSPDPNCHAFTLPIAGGSIQIPFTGCCKATTGKCGYVVDTIGAQGIEIAVDLGCVDGTIFESLEGGTPQPCGSGADGASGTGGAGGTGGTSSDASTDTSTD